MTLFVGSLRCRRLVGALAVLRLLASAFARTSCFIYFDAIFEHVAYTHAELNGLFVLIERIVERNALIADSFHDFFETGLYGLKILMMVIIGH